MSNLIGVAMAFAFVALIFANVLYGNQKTEAFQREISCIESGRDWVNGSCK